MKKDEKLMRVYKGKTPDEIIFQQGGRFLKNPGEHVDFIHRIPDAFDERNLSFLSDYSEKAEFQKDTNVSNLNVVCEEQVCKNLAGLVQFANDTVFQYNLEVIDPIACKIYSKGGSDELRRDCEKLRVSSIMTPDERDERSFERQAKLSFIIALNDADKDYEGGELFIHSSKEGVNVPIKLKRNEAIFFPSLFLHETKQVTKGMRKDIVGTVSGPSFT